MTFLFCGLMITIPQAAIFFTLATESEEAKNQVLTRNASLTEEPGTNCQMVLLIVQNV